MLAAGRLLPEADWNHDSGYDVAFVPRRMTPAALRAAHRALWRRAFSPSFVLDRLARAARTLSPGGLMLSAAMNGFYGLKRLTGNRPADATPRPRPHPSPLPRARAHPPAEPESGVITPGCPSSAAGLRLANVPGAGRVGASAAPRAPPAADEPG